MITLAHISDLHFGRENPRLVDGLLQTLEDIEPQLVVISGDLTQRARTREFLAARAFLDSLQWPLLVIAGNHDISADNLTERFFAPWKKWHRYIANTLEPIVRDKNSIIIGVNTARRSGYSLDWSRGRVNSRQIAAITEYLAEEEGERLRVIAAHHPFWIPKQYRYRHVIGGRDMAIGRLKKAGVDIILSGHVHFAYTHVLNGLIISHAGTAISDRLEADFPNSFKIVRGDRRKLSVETREWRNTCFTKTVNQVFDRIQGEWLESG
jgi:3',5'-cyclic AMP phosphodiesterase CpdA